MKSLKAKVVSLAAATLLIGAMLPMGALAAQPEDWDQNETNRTVKIYTEDGLREWADSITTGRKSYNGYTISIENDMDLAGENWISIIGLGGTVTIDGKNHTISNMSISEKNTQYGGSNTYLGFIGDINYSTRLTVQDLTFENAHVEDLGGDAEYSWCGVVVGHGPMDYVCEGNAECTFRNVNIINSVVTSGHNGGAIMGYSGSTSKGHLFENCTVTDTFVGGYNCTAGTLFGMGHAYVTVRDCTANRVRLYSDGLNFGCTQSDEEDMLWVGHTYETRPNGVTYEGTNTATDTFVVYPVYYHYADNTVKEYVQVNVPLTGAWYADEDCTQPVTEIIASLNEDEDMYPYSNPTLVNDESYETQDTDQVANPLTHGAIPLYTKENQPDKTSFPGLEKWITVDDEDRKDTSVAKGDTVDFKLVSNVPEDLKNYLKPATPDEPAIMAFAFTDKLNGGVYKLAFHDVMDKGLTINEDSISVTVNGTEVTPTKVTVGTDDNGNTTLYVEIELVSLYEDGLFTEEEFGTAPIILTYSAAANKDITAGTYLNKAWVEYENGETSQDTVKIYTRKLEIFKYDQENKEKGLAGAKFELEDEEGNVVTLESGKDGYASEDGLKAGTYTLTEIQAPKGYVKSDTPLTVVIATSSNAVVKVQFANGLIPHTGGSGTKMYTIIGICIIAAAGVFFVVSRRKDEQANK